jgi:NitT/TauT family transport system permease protein
MINTKIIKKIIYPVTAIAVFTALWFAASVAADREYILPSPYSSVKSLVALLSQGVFWQAGGATLFRSLLSFTAAFIAAVALAALSAVSEPVKRLLSPIIVILRAVPTISVILISLIWLKSAVAPMLISFLIVFPAIYAAVLGAILSADKGLIEMCRVYGVSKRDTVTKFYIPSVLPALFTSAKSNISLNLKIIIASEVLANTRISMGFEMQLSKLYLETPALFAWTIAAVIMAFLLEKAVDIIRKLAIKWE